MVPVPELGTQGQQRVKIEQKTSGSDYLWSEEYFDGFGRVVQVRQRDASGFYAITSSTKFNNRGLTANSYVPWRVADTTPESYQSPTGIESTSFTYDALGRVLNETAPDGGVTAHVYEGHWEAYLLWEERITDALSKEKRYAIDVYGRMAKILEMQGASVDRATTYTSDVSGNLTQVVVDPQQDGTLPSVTSTMTYDWLSRKLTMNNPDTGLWSYLYDANGNLTTQTDARGTVLTFEYDALDRQTKKCTPNCSGTTLATYVFDIGTNGKGHRTSMTDLSGSASYTYDSRGRLITEGKTITPSSYTTSFGYDSMDRQTSVTLPGGEVLTTAFNNRGLPLSLTAGGSAIASGATYDRLGLLTQLDFGGIHRTVQEYWGVEHLGTPSNVEFGRLYKQYTNRISDSTVWQDLRYTWDAVGNLTQRQDALHSATENFTYDHLHRLTGETTQYGRSYSYNALDNITSKTGPGTYSYGDSARPHLVTSTQNGWTYSYDANGNTTARPGQTLTWNAENQLTSVINSSTQAVIESYVYDGDGKRVKRTWGSTVYQYVNRFHEKRGGTVIVNYYLGDRLVAVKYGSILKYAHVDSLDSLAAMSNSAGDVMWRAYFPEGITRTTTGTFNGDISFTGQHSDTGSGLYFYNARYYDQNLYRFVSPDGLVPDAYDPRNYHRFSYVLNNPLKYTDPSGNRAFGLPCPKLAKDTIHAVQTAADKADRALVVAVEEAAKGYVTAGDFVIDLFGPQVSQVQTMGAPGLQEPATVAVLGERSLLGRTVAALNGGDGAMTLGFGPYDILSTREFDTYEKDRLARHEFQHLAEIREYGPQLWHGTYQAEQAGRTIWWLFDGKPGFDFVSEVHDQIGKERRAIEVSDFLRDPVEATESAFPWGQWTVGD